MAESVLAITAGDPCGIGPEIVLKALGRGLPAGGRAYIVIGELGIFKKTAKRLRIRLPKWQITGSIDSVDASRNRISFLNLASRAKFVPGRSSAQAGSASLSYLDCAVQLWRKGLIQGLVTGPVTKWAIQRIEKSFVGQTEHLARAMKIKKVAMMFTSRKLKVVLLSRHVPIRDVARSVDQRTVREIILLSAGALRELIGVRMPRLGVCGLNPHAGEDGLFGTEEKRILIPVLRRMHRAGMRIEGPYAADALFAMSGRYDAIICWYHDQGLIPFKMLGRDKGCQLSVGLPIVRTSPDHGSALDIAGKGVAHPGSMRYALKIAAKLAGKVANQKPQRRL